MALCFGKVNTDERFFTDMKKHHLLVITGSRRSGKSSLLQSLHDLPVKNMPMVVFEPGKQMHMYNGFDSDAVKTLLENQKNSNEQKEASLILDDCISTEQWKLEPVLRDLFMYAKTFHVRVSIAVENEKIIPVFMREMVDHIMHVGPIEKTKVVCPTCNCSTQQTNHDFEK